MYVIRTKQRIQGFYYHAKFQTWGYRFKTNFFWNTGPGWATCRQYFESQLLHFFANQYRPKTGDVVLDLGAGLGEESIIFAEWVGEHGQVYAIEATPRIAEALSYAIAANNLHNVSVFNLAISDKNETVEISDEVGYVGNTLNTVVSNKTKTFEVRSLTMDQFFLEQRIKHIDLLKVNIEGAEQLMILGMNDAIKKIRHVAISCHDFRYTSNKESEFYKTFDKVRAYLVSNGFKVSTITSDDTLLNHIVFGENTSFYK
jgi:FkbM family methyltransferase